MPKSEILQTVEWAYFHNYRSIVLQSGERTSKKHLDFLCELIEEMLRITKGECSITLSIGELPFESYQKLFDAGARRYLLRIETSNQSLYKKLHPEDHSFENRRECLYNLKKIGYQIGSGVMIGLPFQTLEDLVNDLLFFKELDLDMVGMGPFLPNKNTPLNSTPHEKEKLLSLSLKMIALARLFLGDVNIVATTALQVLSPNAREKALLSGANVVMPILTPQKYRKDYLLYDEKPCVEETREKCNNCLESRIKKIGKKRSATSGDSPHFLEARC